MADARRDYPEETANTTFVDFSSRHAKKEIAEWYKSLLRARGVSEELLGTYKYKVDIRNFVSGITSERYKDGVAMPARDVGMNLLCMNTKDYTKTGAGVLDNLSFRFNHELGHIVVPNGYDDAAVNNPLLRLRNEQAADNFAILREFKTGVISKEGLRSLGFVRGSESGIELMIKVDDMRTEMVGIVETMSAESLTHQKIKDMANENVLKI